MHPSDDSGLTGVTLSVKPREVVEDAGAAEVRVKAVLDDGPRLSVTMMTVTVTVEEDEDDYTALPATFDVEIPIGETSADEMCPPSSGGPTAPRPRSAPARPTTGPPARSAPAASAASGCS